MNLRNWTKEHTIGLLIGLLTTTAFVFVVIAILSWKDGYSFSYMFKKFTILHNETTKVISLASIANLFWFHRFLSKNKWKLGMGVILATVISLFVILYFKFIA